MPQSGREVVIVEAVRAPIGRGHKEKGYYKDVHANELLGRCYSEVIERAGIDAGEVEDVVAGCVQQYGEQSWNVGRNAWLQAEPCGSQSVPMQESRSTSQSGLDTFVVFILRTAHLKEVALPPPPVEQS